MSLPQNPMFPGAERSKAEPEAEGRVGCGGGWVVKAAKSSGQGVGCEGRDAGGADNTGNPAGALGASSGYSGAVCETAQGDKGDIMGGIGN